MMETIEISIESYASLLKSEYILHCLEAAGVDNWESYDYAMNKELFVDCPTANEIKNWSDDKIILELSGNEIY